MVNRKGFGIQGSGPAPYGARAGFRVSNFKFQFVRLRRSFLELAPALPLCCLLFSGLLRAQMPTGTPTYNANAKWVTDRGSQVYNVKAYGARCIGPSFDDSPAFAATAAAIPPGGGTFFIPPSATPCNLASARLAITTSNVLISGYGATLLCSVADDCVTLGNFPGTPWVNNDSIRGLIIEPGAGSVGHSAIRYNTQGSIIEDVNLIGNGSYRFNHGIEDDDDQGSTVRHIFLNGNPIRCDSTFCGSVIWGPGPYSTNAGITFLSDFSFSPECSGNGIDWWNGNDLKISGGIIQGFNQYAIRIGPTNAVNDVIEEVHVEAGVCTNPLGNLGTAGIIAIGATVSNFGGTLGALLPIFPQAGTTGGTWYGYYIVGHSSSGATPPMAAGGLNNGNAAINSANNITATWYDFGGAGTTYDVLRYPGTSPRTAPYGTGNWAVATGLAESSVCTGGVCTFVDTVTSPSSYTVAGFGGWTPQLSMWPGAIVLSPNGNCYYAARYYGDSQWQGSTITDLCGADVTFTQGLADFQGDWVPLGPGLVKMPGLANPNGGAGALVLPSGGGGSKGQLNMSNGGGPTDIITLHDSNPAKTYSHVTETPSYDVGDAAVCADLTGTCLRDPNAISQYLLSRPDDQSWLERLTSGLKMFKVPLGAFSVSPIYPPNYHDVSDVATGGTLSPNTQYCYRVTALDNLGETTPDGEGCVTTANDGHSTHSVQVYWQFAFSPYATGGYKVYGRATGAEQLLAAVPSSSRAPGNYGYVLWTDTGALTPSGAMSIANTTGRIQPALYSTATNCSSSASPAVCGSATAGSVVIAASATSVVVDTTAVTANSQILLTEDSSLGTKLGVTCNTQSLLTLGVPKVTARTAATSFTASIEVAPTTNPLCVSYAIFN
jgi:hypothetical protein